MKTRVVHLNKEPFDVYIGRGWLDKDRNPVQNKWGNPYSHKDGTLAKFKVSSRKEAIEKYEEYLLNSPELMADLHELKGKVLGCWCKPQSCHGDILAKYANSLDSALF